MSPSSFNRLLAMILPWLEVNKNNHQMLQKAPPVCHYGTKSRKAFQRDHKDLCVLSIFKLFYLQIDSRWHLPRTSIEMPEAIASFCFFLSVSYWPVRGFLRQALSMIVDLMME